MDKKGAELGHTNELGLNSLRQLGAFHNTIQRFLGSENSVEVRDILITVQISFTQNHNYKQ